MEKGNLDIAARGMENLIVCRALFERILPLGLEVDSVYGDEPRERIVEDGRTEEVRDATVSLFSNKGVDCLAPPGAHLCRADLGIEGAARTGDEL